MKKNELKTFWEQVNRDDLEPAIPADRQTLKDISTTDIGWFGEELANIRLARNRAMDAGAWGDVHRLSDMVQELVSDLELLDMEDLAWFVERAHFGRLTKRHEVFDVVASFDHVWERFETQKKAREEAHRNYFGL